MTAAAILLAGGVGSRMGLKTPKQFCELNGMPVALYSLKALQSLEAIQEIILVCSEEFRSCFQGCGSLTFAPPGARRQDSVENGFKALSKPYSHLLIHDAARPFLSGQLLKAVCEETIRSGAAAAAIPVTSTIKTADKHLTATGTLERESLWEMQTPQGIRSDWLQDGLKLADEKNITVTDDLAFAELLKKPSKIVQGDDRNIKITTPKDWAIAQVIASEWNREQVHL